MNKGGFWLHSLIYSFLSSTVGCIINSDSGGDGFSEGEGIMSSDSGERVTTGGVESCISDGEA